MIFELLNLELKQLFRSSALAKNVMVNVLAGFTILFLFTQLLIIGASLPHFIYSFTGNPDSLWVVNTYLAHYFVMEFLMRYLVQKVPGANIAPLLHLPVKKTLLTTYLIGKSLFSPYNMVVMCIFIPFTLRVVVPEYGNLAGLFWFGIILPICQTN